MGLRKEIILDLFFHDNIIWKRYLYMKKYKYKNFTFEFEAL
jgi:hypothetical protein